VPGPADGRDDGHDDAATRERCLRAGCADVLLKPVPTRDLLRLVAAYVPS
jgi:CheY-like chemotaxis protein